MIVYVFKEVLWLILYFELVYMLFIDCGFKGSN